MKAREPKPDISTALMVEHFCQMFGVSEPLYRALRRNHLGPREVRVGDVRFNAHCGLKSDIAACPKSAESRSDVIVCCFDLLSMAAPFHLTRDHFQRAMSPRR
jgi:hypothetical protein